MKIVKFSELNEEFFKYKEFSDIESVSEIIADVKKNGDKSIIDYGRKFGDGNLSSLLLTDEEINNAVKTVSQDIADCLKQSIANVKRFSEAQFSILEI